MTLTLTQTDAQALIQILDIATKAGGLNVAEACIYFQKMINNAHSASSASNTEERTEETQEAVS